MGGVDQLAVFEGLYFPREIRRSEVVVICEKVEIDGRVLTRHKSDCGKLIRQVETGREYASAIDSIPCRYTYEETEKDILKRQED